MSNCRSWSTIKKNVKICGSLRVGGNLQVRGDILAENIIGTGTISAPFGRFSIITYPNPVEVIVNKELSANGITVFNKIQDALDAYSGRQVQQLSITIAPGIYDENLRFDKLAAGGNRTAGLIGDPRRVIGMTYINGDINSVRSVNISTTQAGGVITSYFPLLGTRGGKINFIQTSSPGNDVTVNINAAPLSDPDAGGAAGFISQPDFDDALVGPVKVGDQISLVDAAGNIQERGVTGVLNNRISFDGAPIDLSGIGASITFLPNVDVRPLTPSQALTPFPSLTNGLPAVFFSGPCNLNITGIRFTRDPSVLVSGFFSVVGVLDCCALQMDNCVIVDSARRAGASLFISDNSSIFVNRVLTIIGSTTGFDIDGEGNIWDGDIYVVSQATVGVTTNFKGNLFAVGLHVSTPSSATGLGINSTADSNIGATRLISCINCPNAISVAGGSSVVCSTANYYLFGRGGTGNAIRASQGSKVTAGPVDYYAPPIIPPGSPVPGSVINGFGRGLFFTAGSVFASQANVTITNTPVPYITDQSSQLATDYNVAGSNPTPNNIFLYSSPGLTTMNPSYLTQAFNTAAPVTLTLNPSLNVAPAALYIGKTYTLFSRVPGPHILTLTGAAFVGLGTGTVATFAGLSSSEFITFTVISNTQVLVTSRNGVIFV